MAFPNFPRWEYMWVSWKKKIIPRDQLSTLSTTALNDFIGMNAPEAESVGEEMMEEMVAKGDDPASQMVFRQGKLAVRFREGNFRGT